MLRAQPERDERWRVVTAEAKKVELYNYRVMVEVQTEESTSRLQGVVHQKVKGPRGGTRVKQMVLPVIQFPVQRQVLESEWQVKQLNAR
jgi:hypothetical protein